MSEENTVLPLLGIDGDDKMEITIEPAIHHVVAKVKFDMSVVDQLNEEIDNASIPNASWLEHMGWYNHLWVNSITPKDGTATPPNIPGHGMQFKPELFKEFPYKNI